MFAVRGSEPVPGETIWPLCETQKVTGSGWTQQEMRPSVYLDEAEDKQTNILMQTINKLLNHQFKRMYHQQLNRLMEPRAYFVTIAFS